MSFKKLLSGWITEDGPESDVVMSTRIRLARNIEKYVFPTSLSGEEAREVVDEVQQYAIANTSEKTDAFVPVIMENLQMVEKRVLMEKHLISPYLIQNSLYGACLLSKDETVSIMINEEDHLRIQTLQPGLQLKEALEVANEVDDWLEQNINYAFDEKRGYLTSCPTNVGTGLRASVMMHLPGLALTNQMNRILPAMNQLGFIVRGIYGEGSEALGNIFQISNQMTLGKSEDDIVFDLRGVIKQLIVQERSAREMLVKNSKVQLEDRIWRAFGTLTNSRIIKSKEAATCLSDVRLGIDLHYIPNISPKIFNELMVLIQPGMMQQYVGAPLRVEDRDIKRASLIRERFQKEKFGVQGG